ncbi:DUF2637 domain-containing protein [Aeromicrobium camelliae]|uniref:DUF2637 domain-containing protein n=1 Tax=Aeromicrobium camelliae TaxID=1538144 RepID=UPI00362FAFF1
MSRGVIAAAIAGTFALALGAFLLSFEALQDLARLAGIAGGQAWLWPLIVDGVILQATISVVALRDAEGSARRFAWMLLAAGTGVSVAANITHAVLTADQRVPGLVAALVASVPPLVLVAMTHLTVELIRNAGPRHDQDQQEQPPSPVVVTERRVPDRTPPALEAGPAQDHDAREASELRSAPSRGTNSRSRQERDANRREAARLAGQGLSYREIARRRGVHPTTVARWLNAPDPADERNDDEHEPDTEQP